MRARILLSGIRLRLLTAFLVLSSPLLAERYALLIGIGDYARAGIRALDGPPNDVDSIKQVLLTRAGYKPDKVRVLLNGDATKARILDELRHLADTVQPGDYVVFFYSGHGTSNGDPAMRRYALDAQTGALLPADYQSGTPETVIRSLIIGKRDLRPLFTRIQQKATLLALFDTCFSQDAAKDILVHPTPRYIPLSDLMTAKSPNGEEEFARDEQNDVATLVEEAFPYQRVVSIAAAARNQQAHDISARQVQFNPDSTIDHKPHGVFTNGILTGLKGPADQNHDGVITHQEIFAYLQEQSLHWQQNPQIQYPKSNAGLLEQPLFGGNRSTADIRIEDKKTFSAQLVGVDPALRERIRKLPRITLTEQEGDLLVKKGSRGGYLLSQGNGRALDRGELSADDLVARVGAEPALQDLIGLRYGNPGMNVMLTPVAKNFPSGQTLFLEGQELQFEVRASKKAYLLLLDIDTEGTVTVVYPSQTDPLTPVDARQSLILGDGGKTTPPFGMEFLKLFAFEQKPTGYDTLRANDQERIKQISPASAEFRNLLSMLKTQDGAAEIAVRIITKER